MGEGESSPSVTKWQGDGEGQCSTWHHGKILLSGYYSIMAYSFWRFYAQKSIRICSAQTRCRWHFSGGADFLVPCRIFESLNQLEIGFSHNFWWRIRILRLKLPPSIDPFAENQGGPKMFILKSVFKKLNQTVFQCTDLHCSLKTCLNVTKVYIFGFGLLYTFRIWPYINHIFYHWVIGPLITILFI